MNEEIVYSTNRGGHDVSLYMVRLKDSRNDDDVEFVTNIQLLFQVKDHDESYLKCANIILSKIFNTKVEIINLTDWRDLKLFACGKNSPYKNGSFIEDARNHLAKWLRDKKLISAFKPVSP